MEIIWLAHACFRLRGKDVAVITDPFDRSLGLQIGRQNAEIVTVSHDSPYHNAAQAVAGHPRLVRGPGEYEIGGVMVAGVATAGGDEGEGPARNTAYALELDDITICHLGSLGKSLTPEQVEALKDPDVLFIPVGGNASISPAEAAEVVSQLEPKLVIPMAYAIPGLSIQLEPIDRFAREMGLEELRTLPKLAVTRGSLPDETSVLLLEPSAAKVRS